MSHVEAHKRSSRMMKMELDTMLPNLSKVNS